MHRSLFLLSTTVFLASCTLGEPPPVPVVTPPVSVVVAPTPPPPPPLVLPFPLLEPLPVSYAPVPTPAPSPSPLKAPLDSRPGQARRAHPVAQTPQQLMQQALQAAMVEPTPEGFFGASGTLRYLWQPGKIYKIYVMPGQATKLTFPPGETLAHYVGLNPKAFDVVQATVGSEERSWSVLQIMPCMPGREGCEPSPDVNVPLTSHSGRSYNIRLILGKKEALVDVTWELVPVPHIQVEESGTPPRRFP